MSELNEDTQITVCDACLTAGCLRGMFYCDKYKTAGTIDKTVKELRELNREHSVFWLSEKSQVGEARAFKDAAERRDARLR